MVAAREPWFSPLRWLDWLDDFAIARKVRRRDRNDDGTRLSLDELIAEQGFDRAELEAEIRAEDSQEQPQ